MMFPLFSMSLWRQISRKDLYFCVSKHYEEKTATKIYDLKKCHCHLQVFCLVKVLNYVDINLGRGMQSVGEQSECKTFLHLNHTQYF